LVECSTFDSKQIELLNGKFIHQSDFRDILKHNIVTIQDDGIVAINGYRETKYLFNKNCGVYPNAKIIIEQIEKREPVPVSKIGMNLSYLEKLKKALSNGKSIALFFKGEGVGILAKNSSMHYKSVGLIMSLMIDQE
jgi:hypothetical protein